MQVNSEMLYSFIGIFRSILSGSFCWKLSNKLVQDFWISCVFLIAIKWLISIVIISLGAKTNIISIVHKGLEFIHFSLSFIMNIVWRVLHYNNCLQQHIQSSWLASRILLNMNGIIKKRWLYVSLVEHLKQRKRGLYTR